MLRSSGVEKEVGKYCVIMPGLLNTSILRNTIVFLFYLISYFKNYNGISKMVHAEQGFNKT